MRKEQASEYQSAPQEAGFQTDSNTSYGLKTMVGEFLEENLISCIIS
jgi:hypothetical protein